MINQIINNPILLVLTVLVVTAMVVTIIFVAIPYVTKKGISLPDLFKKADNVTAAAETIMNTAEAILPDNPIVKELNVVETFTKKAVSGVEQMYIASQLTADQRKEKAGEIVSAALKVAGITVTDDLQKVIDGIIEAEVLALGHKTPTEAQTVAEKQELKNQVAALTNENTTLKKTIATIQTATIAL